MTCHCTLSRPARQPGRLVAVLATGAVVAAVLTGCSGTGDSSPQASPSVSALAPVSSPSASPSVAEPVQATPAPGETAEAPASVFGADAVEAGVRAAYEVDAVSASMAGLLSPGPHAARDYEPLRVLLSAERWSDLERAVAVGDPEGAVGSLALTADEHGAVVIGGERVTLTAPYVAGYKAGDHRLGVDHSVEGKTRLVVDVRSTQTLVTKGGPVDHAVVRTYWLSLAGEGRWLVDGWATP